MNHLDTFRQLTEHRHYVYRGCAPDPDNPRYAAGDDRLPLDAWGGSTVDGGLRAAERLDFQRRAMEICGRCPVLAQCRTNATSELPGGGLAEPEGIQGGMKPLERRREYIARRTAAGIAPEPRIAEAQTPTRLAVLHALAVETDAELVAYKAGMDLRAANWHRSALCSIFGLDKESASREELLAMAKAYGVLPARARIVPDGPWPVVAAPNTDGTRQRRIAPGRPEQTVITGLLPQPAPAPTAPVRRRRAARPRPTAPGGRPALTLARPPAARPVPLPLPVRTLEVRAA
ncbi:WhiB family transcriptional regulator [Streptomyces hydrogenans]